MQNPIVIRGARENNLKNINLDLPRHKLIVVTGVSGSGKSSLVFDTVYAEGHRRYVESLSTYARQFLERIDKPEIDYMEGISPSIAFEQRNPVRHSRSTVGTTTEIYDYLRLLFAKIGRTFCPECGTEVRSGHIEDIAEEILKECSGHKILVTFQARPSASLPLKTLLRDFLARGYIRVGMGEEILPIDHVLTLNLAGVREVAVIVDRLVARHGVRSRLVDSLETAFIEGRGVAAVKVIDGPLLTYSQDFCCSKCLRPFEPPTPKLFSFNSPSGACPRCRGFGNVLSYDPDLVVPDKTKSLAQGAIEPWNKPRYAAHFRRELAALARTKKVDLNKPFHKLTKRQRRWVWEGTEEFIGVIPFFKRMEAKKYKAYIRFFTRRYQSTADCDLCHGTRLRHEALNVKIHGHSIAQMSAMTVSRLRELFATLPLTRTQREVGRHILKQIQARLDFLQAVGVHYLTLERMTKTLSGGEAQRVNLANQLGGQLVGALYILDEPTIGLHPRDNKRLLNILKRLSKAGNTVLVVEHDRDVIASADYVVDLGPLAGEQGGEVVFAGPARALTACEHSLTAQYMTGGRRIPVPGDRRRPGRGALYLLGASENNLKNINLRLPLGLFVCVTGVSGSGKSTLVHDTLYNALNRIFYGLGERTGRFTHISGFDRLRAVVLLDQRPIGRTPRSNPVTHMKAFAPIRRLFAETPAARARRYTPSHFSFNRPGGRCEVCKGEGQIRIEMHFMADVFAKCGECNGTRFKREILRVKYRGKTIHDVLRLTVQEALAFFADQPELQRSLGLLAEVGLGYLRLGQPATTLSGGEAQRLKIAAQFARRKPHDVLYILDEPTTGLHFDDIQKLLAVLNRLVDLGNTVLMVEHNLEVIKTADYVVDLGPGGGEEGGYIIAEGTPEDIAQNEESHTGKYLRTCLKTTA